MTPEEKLAFDVYFASVVSMQFHPGAGTKEHARLSLEDAAAVAMEMVKLRRIVTVN